MIAERGADFFAFRFADVVLVIVKIDLQRFFYITFDVLVIQTDAVFGIHPVLHFTILHLLLCLITDIHGMLHPLEERSRFCSHCGRFS